MAKNGKLSNKITFCFDKINLYFIPLLCFNAHPDFIVILHEDLRTLYGNNDVILYLIDSLA